MVTGGCRGFVPRIRKYFKGKFSISQSLLCGSSFFNKDDIFLITRDISHSEYLYQKIPPYCACRFRIVFLINPECLILAMVKCRSLFNQRFKVSKSMVSWLHGQGIIQEAESQFWTGVSAYTRCPAVGAQAAVHRSGFHAMRLHLIVLSTPSLLDF